MSLKVHFVPSAEHLIDVKRKLELGEEGNEYSFDVIRNMSFRVLTTKFRSFMDVLLPYRKDYIDKRPNSFDPLKRYYKGSFSSKEEFLCHMGQISEWLYGCNLGSLGSAEAMKLISHHFGTNEYAFFSRFCDKKEVFVYYD